MGSEGNGFRQKDIFVYIGRLGLVLTTVVVAAMTFIQLAVALRVESSRALVQKAMWGGAILWLVVAAVGWAQKLMNGNTPISQVLALTAITAGTVVGIYLPAFVGVTLWANATLSVLFLVAGVSGFRRRWKSCAAPSKES